VDGGGGAEGGELECRPRGCWIDRIVSYRGPNQGRPPVARTPERQRGSCPRRGEHFVWSSAERVERSGEIPIGRSLVRGKVELELVPPARNQCRRSFDMRTERFSPLASQRALSTKAGHLIGSIGICWPHSTVVGGFSGSMTFDHTQISNVINQPYL